MRKKRFLCLILSLLLAVGLQPWALASTAEYKAVAQGAQDYSNRVARVFYENGTYTPDFWSAFAARKAYLLNEKEYAYLLPKKAELAVPEDISAPALADVILQLYISSQRPRDVGGKDLPQQLANMGKVDGTFGENLTVIEHAKILLALEWTGVAYFNEAALDHLASYRGEGGLMLNADGKESVVCTAWALMAASLSAYTEPLEEQLVIALKTAISPEGYFCSEVESPGCTTQAMAIIALCFANVNLASESYVSVLDAFNSFQLSAGAFSETVVSKKADNAVTNLAWVAAGMIREMYGELEALRDREEQAEAQGNASNQVGATSTPQGGSPIAQNNTANRKFPTAVAVVGGVCLALLVGTLCLKKKK